MHSKNLFRAHQAHCARRAYQARCAKRRQRQEKEDTLNKLLDDDLDYLVFGKGHRQVRAHTNAIICAVDNASSVGGSHVAIELLKKSLTEPK